MKRKLLGCFAEVFGRGFFLMLLFGFANGHFSWLCSMPEDMETPKFTVLYFVMGLLISFVLGRFLSEKARKMIAKISNVVLVLVGVVAIACFLGKESMIGGAAYNFFGWMVGRDDHIAGCGYRAIANWIWFAICACAAFGFMLKRKEKFAGVAGGLGIIAAAILYVVASALLISVIAPMQENAISADDLVSKDKLVERSWAINALCSASGVMLVANYGYDLLPTERKKKAKK